MPTLAGVQILELPHGPVQEGQDVLHVHGAHPLLDGPAVRLAVTGGTPRIAHQHGVTGPGVDLGFVEQAPPPNWANGPPWMFSSTGCGPGPAGFTSQPWTGYPSAEGNVSSCGSLMPATLRSWRGEIRQAAELPAVEHAQRPRPSSSR